MLIGRFFNEIVKKSVKIMAQNEKPIYFNRRFCKQPAVLRKNREHGLLDQNKINHYSVHRIDHNLSRDYEFSSWYSCFLTYVKFFITNRSSFVPLNKIQRIYITVNDILFYFPLCDFLCLSLLFLSIYICVCVFLILYTFFFFSSLSK